MDKYQKYLNDISNEIRRKGISDLESKVLERLQSSTTYENMAKELNYNSSYIADTARELFGLIGQKHRVKVTRTNIISVLDGLIDTEPQTDFFVCHNIKTSVFMEGVLKFKQDEITFNISPFWKFDGINKCLILKTKNPIILKFEDLTQDKLGTTLVNLSRQKQVSGSAVLELLKILDTYLNE